MNAYSTEMIISRLNALRPPIQTIGMLTWLNIALHDVYYMRGSWFIDGYKCKKGDIEIILTKIEAMCE